MRQGRNGSFVFFFSFFFSFSANNPRIADKREPVRVRAAWSFGAQHPDELSLTAGEVLVRWTKEKKKKAD